jgi:hypothetical protein
VFEFWLVNENLPFVGAGFLLVGLMLLQFSGLGDFAPDLDADMDGQVDGLGAADGLLSFLGLGRLPLMIWLALFLLLFMIIGYVGQQVIQGMTGNLLSPWIAAPLAALFAIPSVAILARPLARIMPARFGAPARAKVIDIHGHPHFVMVEPDNDGQQFTSGEKLLLVRREGNLFKAISQGGQHLPRLEG